MRQYPKFLFSVAVVAFSTGASAVDTITTSPASAQLLATVGVTGKPLSAFQFSDSTGDNVLVLTRVRSGKEAKIAEESMRTIDLSAKLFTRKPGAVFGLIWEIKDHVTCPAMIDVDADFYPHGMSVTDLNKNGTAEVTVAYHMFCGGDVSPSTVKVILREGGVKYAIRGESKLVMPAQAPIGGNFKPDAALKTADPAIQQHMSTIWKAVYLQKM